MADEARKSNPASRSQGGRGLGRGLSALLGESDGETREPGEAPRSRNLPIAFLKPNPRQPRRLFDPEELKDLAASIEAKGVLQPILVRPTGSSDVYEIVAGERRWRAAQAAKLHEVPVIVRTLTDSQSLEIAIIENVQRSDLSVLEEAGAYQDLMSRFSYTQEEMAGIIGKSRSHIANTLRLLKLPESVKVLIAEGKLTAGHARTLVGAADAESRARQIVDQALNVRQAEKNHKPSQNQAKSKTKLAPPAKDSDTRALEHSLSSSLGMEVQIDYQGNKGGTVNIQYSTLEQLDEIVRRLSFYGEVD
jgi:ParB family transcriptional regulator, chromosome partitioning protein